MKSSIQQFFENALYSLLTIIKVCVQSRFITKIDLHGVKRSEKILIIGNGPSLNETINSNLEFIHNKDILCVNFFSRTDLYEKLQPNYYVITSPEYFMGEKKEGWKEDRNKTFVQIAEKTSWEMVLLVPVLARKNKEWKKLIIKNDKIRIAYFNTTPVEGFKKLNFSIYKLKLGLPRPHNVLIPSIFVAINMGYKSLYLAGADHNWTKELFVTDSNEVLLSQKHFYDKNIKNKMNKNSSLPKPMYKGGSLEKRKLHEVLMKFVYAFQAYWEIKEYAVNVKKIDIYNITPGSFIDAFDKISLNDGKSTVKKTS